MRNAIRHVAGARAIAALAALAALGLTSAACRDNKALGAERTRSATQAAIEQATGSVTTPAPMNSAARSTVESPPEVWGSPNPLVESRGDANAASNVNDGSTDVTGANASTPNMSRAEDVGARSVDSSAEPPVSVDDGSSRGTTRDTSRDDRSSVPSVPPPENAAAARGPSSADTAPNAADRTLEKLAAAQCDYARRCNLIGTGPGKSWLTREACLSDVRGELAGSLNANDCRGGVIEPNVTQCLSDVRLAACTSSLSVIDNLASCRTADMCTSQIP